MLRHNFNHLEVLHSNAVATSTASHTHTFNNFRREGRSDERTRSAETVMLTVSSLTYTTESVAFNNALKSFTFRSTDNIDPISLFEY